MNTKQRIEAFVMLGQAIQSLSQNDKESLFRRAADINPWFTPANIERALAGIVSFLDKETLERWLGNYKTPFEPRSIGIIMAGNIPLVGFHDMLSVLITGHKAIIKLSSQDEVLPKAVIDLLTDADPAFIQQIEIVETLPTVDAVIATGSNNSSRYFKKYFANKPHIIRMNRTSIAVLDGNESVHEQEKLGDDIFSYFGMGCRNVSKLFVPEGYKIENLLSYFEVYEDIINHPKYFNNYEYNKAIFLVNRIEHLDNGFALFTESKELVSPLSVVYFEFYTSMDDLKGKLDLINDHLQCIVGNIEGIRKLIPFGQAQSPAIDDYADDVDTMKFLSSL